MAYQIYSNIGDYKEVFYEKVGFDFAGGSGNFLGRL